MDRVQTTVKDRISLMDHVKGPEGVSHCGCNTNGPLINRGSNTNIRKLITEANQPLLIPYSPYLISHQTVNTFNGLIICLS